MSSDVRPNGLVALLASGRIQEQASGEIHEGKIRPLQYERQLNTGKKSSHMQLRLTGRPSGGGALQRRSGHLLLTPGIVDPLSLQLLVMGDLQHGQVPPQYRV